MKKSIVFFAVVMLITATSAAFAGGTSNIDSVVVPEPGSIAALATGLVGFAGLIIRKRKA